MKRIVLIAFAFLSFGYIFGQIQITPISFDTCIDPSVADLALDSEVKNLGKSGIEILWVRTIISQTKAWDNYVCTGSQCYPPTTEDGSFTLASAGTAPIYMHFSPNQTKGNSMVTITLTEKGNPSNTSTVTYNVCAESTATNNVANANSILLYPNPTIEYFMIQNKNNVAKVNLSNIAGRQVKTFNTPRDRYEVSDLLPGIYIVQLIDSKNKVIKTSRLSIQRP